MRVKIYMYNTINNIYTYFFLAHVIIRKKTNFLNYYYNSRIYKHLYSTAKNDRVTFFELS